MQCAEPKVAYVQPNTREAKNIVKLERKLTYIEKLTTIAARDWRLARASIECRPTLAVWATQDTDDARQFDANDVKVKGQLTCRLSSRQKSSLLVNARAVKAFGIGVAFSLLAVTPSDQKLR